ncbi:MAG: recombination protein NinB [Dysgonamonadaceae bacterium]|jgi:hypothetical protein|nr:recombination protein NinB [Dysgonamonadaceae bacterium]
MFYDFSKTFDIERARAYLEKLIEKKKKTEITEKRPKRTLSQNDLFHVWVAVLADFAGYESREDCKRDIKRVILGQRECLNRLTGEVEKTDYETHLMDTKEMSNLMDRFKAWAMTEQGCYLPYKYELGYEDMIKEYN